MILVNQGNDFFVNAPDQHHFHHVHRVGIGDPQPIFKLRFNPNFVEPGVNFGTSAMHNNGP
jgi:hypothetical protein